MESGNLDMLFLLNHQNLKERTILIIEENGLMQDLMDLMEPIMNGIKLKTYEDSLAERTTFSNRF